MGKKSKATKTLVTFLLDRTGSMEGIKDDTIGAFNAYLDGLQQGGEDIDFTLVQFDSQSLDKTCVRVPVKQAPKLDKSNYEPRASTPLIDASYKTIKAVEGSLNGDAKTKVVICIQTDGQENCSTEHTWLELNALIKEKTALGWQFIFMGASIDAYEQGTRMGISRNSTVSYDSTNRAATMASFGASASNTRSFASGQSLNVDYSALQKQASGDKFDLDSQRSGLAATPKPATPSTPTKPRPAVDDFKL